MTHPYAALPPQQYWKQGVAEAADPTDLVFDPSFAIRRGDRVASAGSCFAQHISRALKDAGFRFLVTEEHAPASGVADENYGVFSARFGNVYTMRQMLQLFERAYGLFRPRDAAWPGHAGEWIDPFRPRIQRAGFPDQASLEADRARHLGAVRRMVETADVLLFTLGLTEYWRAADGAAFPLPPAVVSPGAEGYEFANASCAEVVAEGDALIAGLREVNPALRIVLTVSPVPLVATHERRHVLVSTVASKSILRAAVEDFCRRHDAVHYFPSYEIVAGHPSRARFFAPDMREVTPEGVAAVMAVFRRHHLVDAGEAPPAVARATTSPPPPVALTEDDLRRHAAVQAVVCDEDAIVLPPGATA